MYTYVHTNDLLPSFTRWQKRGKENEKKEKGNGPLLSIPEEIGRSCLFTQSLIWFSLHPPPPSPPSVPEKGKLASFSPSSFLAFCLFLATNGAQGLKMILFTSYAEGKNKSTINVDIVLKTFLPLIR